jgi:hypothetical protein
MKNVVGYSPRPHTLLRHGCGRLFSSSSIFLGFKPCIVKNAIGRLSTLIIHMLAYYLKANLITFLLAHYDTVHSISTL